MWLGPRAVAPQTANPKKGTPSSTQIDSSSFRWRSAHGRPMSAKQWRNLSQLRLCRETDPATTLSTSSPRRTCQGKVTARFRVVPSPNLSLTLT